MDAVRGLCETAGIEVPSRLRERDSGEQEEAETRDRQMHVLELHAGYTRARLT
jgi:hypothetical protein